jgi:2-methylcitrate dehydratase PrpD
MTGSDRFRPEYLSDQEGFRILAVSHKPYPAWRWVHASLDALHELIDKHDLKPHDVEKVEVHTIRPVADGFGNPSPANISDAVFSVAYPVAMVLYDVPEPNWYIEANLKDAPYSEMASKIEVQLDPEAQKRFEDQETVADFVPTTVVVTTRDGETYSRYAEVPRGTPMKPLSFAEIKGKFLHLTVEALGSEQCVGLWRKLQNLEQVNDMSELTWMMRSDEGVRPGR